MLAGEARRIASDRPKILGSHPDRKPLLQFEITTQ
jgi:hypothetical protein